MADCAFPRCDSPAEDDRDMCVYHAKVYISATGSYHDDRHKEGGHG